MMKGLSVALLFWSIGFEYKPPPLELDLLSLLDCLLSGVGAVVEGVHGPLAIVLLADVLVFGLLSHDKCLKNSYKLMGKLTFRERTDVFCLNVVIVVLCQWSAQVSQ